jgi:rSAM/selenodomain-associated transferase 2
MPGWMRPAADPVRPLVSVIVPVLDEADQLPLLLDHLASLSGSFEILVAEGGSSDRSPEIARAHALRPRVVTAGGGRGAQLNAAAAEAAGILLLFLHADTFLPSNAFGSLADAERDPRLIGGNFELRFDGADRFSRFLAAVARVQRRLGIYYGDSAVFVRKDAFGELGGFRSLTIMDDYDFVRRMERHGRTICLPGPAITSARRWRRLGIARTLASWVAIQLLFWAGVPAGRLARLYGRPR